MTKKQEIEKEDLLTLLPSFLSTYKVITKKGEIYTRLKIFITNKETGELIEINDIMLKGANKEIIEVFKERDMLDI